MASIDGLQNNALIVNTLDGLTVITTAGGIVDPSLYVPYTGATGNVVLGSNALSTTGFIGADTFYGNTIQTVSNPMNFKIDTAYAFNYLVNNVPVALIGSANILSYGIFRSMDYATSNNWSFGLNKTTLDLEFKYNNTKIIY